MNGLDLGLPDGYDYDYSWESCVGACNLYNQQDGLGDCVGVTYQLGTDTNGCYPKSSISGNSAAPGGFNAARLIYSGYPAIADAPYGATFCPSDAFTVEPMGDANYEIECGYQIYGDDIASPTQDAYTYNNTLAGCVGACNFLNDNVGAGTCAGALFGADVDGTPCYLKGTVTSIAADQDYQAGRLIYSAYPSPTDQPARRRRH